MSNNNYFQAAKVVFFFDIRKKYKENFFAWLFVLFFICISHLFFVPLPKINQLE